ncbi:hypothetical protein ACX80S_01160 [Arthrobacter sp. RHLT1-20]
MYLAGDKRTAYAEALAMARVAKDFRNAIAFAARQFGVPLATLTVEDREPTTHIAQWLREQVLDDGNYAAGVRAHSKYGGGVCWAYWMRRRDDNLGANPVAVLAATEIHSNDSDLECVLAMYGLDCR